MWLLVVLGCTVTSAWAKCDGTATTPPPVDELAKAFNNSVNVRTVLFRESDACRLCWSKHDLNLLIARRLVQDLIPRKVPRDFQALLSYYSTVIAEVREKFSEGKNLQIMQTALYDAFGGFLYSVVMPVLNEAYYAGNVDYQTASQLHTMLGVMMEYLGTNGKGWAPPCDMSRIPTKVAPLPLKMPKVSKPCEPFVIPQLHKENGSNSCGSDDKDSCSPDSSITETKIQIPFLDDNTYPSAVAVPLKEHPLFSLMSECSVNLIPKYYIMAMRCLSCSSFTNKDVIAFNKNLHRWIVVSVVPHLHEHSRWYPGFGSIMRVVETMNQRGLSSNYGVREQDGSTTEGVCLDIPEMPCLSKTGGCGGGSMWWLWLLFLLLLLLLLWALIHCCLFILRKRSKGEDECGPENKPANPLVNLYCGLKSKKGKKKSASSRSSEDPYEDVYSPRSTGHRSTGHRSTGHSRRSHSLSDGKTDTDGSSTKYKFPRTVFAKTREERASQKGMPTDRTSSDGSRKHRNKFPKTVIARSPEPRHKKTTDDRTSSDESQNPQSTFPKTVFGRSPESKHKKVPTSPSETESEQEE